MNYRILLLSSVLLITLLPTVQANEFCETTTTIKVSGLISATDITICANYREEYGEIGDVGNVGFRVSVPNAASTPTITLTAGTPVGCTLTTATTRSISGTAGASASYFNQFTATDTTCMISVRIQVSLSATPVFDEDFSIGGHCTCAQQKNLLSGSISAAISGSLTLSGSLSVTESGTLNVVNSGGQNVAITSWPTLTAALSGGLTITDDANGWAINSVNALSGTVNVVNSGGQTVAVSSWPALLATLSGNVGVDVLDDTITDGMLTVPVSTFDGNVTTVDNTNVTETNGFTSSVVKGSILLGIFILAIAIAEWKKDAIYHMIAALIGALTMTATVDHLGIPRLIILAVVAYQLWRMFNVMGSSRNNIQATNT